VTDQLRRGSQRAEVRRQGVGHWTPTSGVEVHSEWRL
jgi:hypothetical protein